MDYVPVYDIYIRSLCACIALSSECILELLRAVKKKEILSVAFRITPTLLCICGLYARFFARLCKLNYEPVV